MHSIQRSKRANKCMGFECALRDICISASRIYTVNTHIQHIYRHTDTKYTLTHTSTRDTRCKNHIDDACARCTCLCVVARVFSFCTLLFWRKRHTQHFIVIANITPNGCAKFQCFCLSHTQQSFALNTIVSIEFVVFQNNKKISHKS